MFRSFAMDGFELRLSEGVLEMRTEGVRTSGMGDDSGRFVETALSTGEPRAMLFDIRDAHYIMEGLEWEERSRQVARLTRHLPVAMVIRNDQRDQAKAITRLHRELGSQSAIFTSRSQARDWLQKAAKGTARTEQTG